MNGEAILALRADLGWTQDQLADFLGVNRSVISRIENGQPASGPVLKLLDQLRSSTPRRPRDVSHETTPSTDEAAA